jgi:hypothetical protein
MKSLNDYLLCKEYEKIVSKATATENGLTFELINDSKFEIAKWKIDNCILKAEDGSKCDYLLIVKESSSCYWIELKDQDLDDACLQIWSTIKGIKEVNDYKTHYARIVLGRFTEDRNRIDDLRYVNHKKLLNTIGRNKLEYKTKLLTETI